ncbi:folate-binding protein [Alteriqipengyuania flavescens]|uniref:CAF17-like 4Fe-4S cluster assembly/insertion protein YgfZ n=1 Tax=Alteriqipengyuania flavescens TaxID=3053610 RepID=UPI0025B5814C|nr:folate-binding protein [Alteriqipengyuania flavescens]WJY18834.1 folate-binding protein [Alteriqipengyuania flavescens]WJY24774.1 folate-binding protein [Alteriqipengyuania flavescens]
MTATRLFDRAVIRLSPTDDGEDVAAFLQGLLTNDVTGKLPAYSALLSAQGKTMFDCIVWPGGKDVLLDCEAAHAEEFATRLSLYRLRRKIDIAVDDGVGVHWQAELGDGGAPDPRLAALGQRWLAPVAEEDEAADAAWTKHRLSLGVPEGRAELGDILWLETNAAELNGVSFEKGCYIGQENTARMNWRQKVNRRLLVRPLDKSDEKRRKHAWPELGYAIDHVRVADVATDAWPDWVGRAEAP